MATAEKEEIGRCTSCGARLWSDHPYAWCSQCGKPLPTDVQARIPALQATRAAAEAAASGTQGETLQVGGKQIHCPICGHDRFWTRRTVTGSRAVAFFDLEWASRAADNHVCHRCGYVLWFLR